MILAYHDLGIGSFVGESMHDDGSVVLAYYKEGATDPTFLYFAYALKEVKCWQLLQDELFFLFSQIGSVISCSLCFLKVFQSFESLAEFEKLDAELVHYSKRVWSLC